MGDAEWQQKWQHALEPTYEGLKRVLQASVLPPRAAFGAYL